MYHRFLCSAIVLMLVAHPACGLRCMSCLTTDKEKDCDADGSAEVCTHDLAQRYLPLFKSIFPNLESPIRGSYNCFNFSVDINAQKHYHLKGCMYQYLPICDDLPDDGFTCNICNIDECNGMNYVPDSLAPSWKSSYLVIDVALGVALLHFRMYHL